MKLNESMHLFTNRDFFALRKKEENTYFQTELSWQDLYNHSVLYDYNIVRIYTSLIGRLHHLVLVVEE